MNENINNRSNKLQLNIFNKCVSTAGSILNDLEKREQYDNCASYTKPGPYAHELLHNLTISGTKPGDGGLCGCPTTSLTSFGPCRDLDLYLILDNIFWRYWISCRPTATVACKTAVKELANAWIKVPTDEDKFCADFYNGAQFWNDTCN